MLDLKGFDRMIAIIDYDAGNIKSVEKGSQYLGEEAVITRDRDVIMASDKVILPGVGSFGDAMNKIRSMDLRTLSMMLWMQTSHFLEYALDFSFCSRPARSRKSTGLGILERRDSSYTRCPGLKIPQIGWNNLGINPKGDKTFQGAS